MLIKSITNHSIELSNEELIQLKDLLELAKITKYMPNDLTQLANNLIEAATIALSNSSTSSSVVNKKPKLDLNWELAHKTIPANPEEYKLDDYTIKLVDDFTDKMKKAKEAYQDSELQITIDKPIIDTTI